MSSVDNLIRPLVISSATQFLSAGDVRRDRRPAAFGLIGMFVGPVIVAVLLLAVWREWLEDQTPAGPGAPPAV